MFKFEKSRWHFRHNIIGNAELIGYVAKGLRVNISCFCSHYGFVVHGRVQPLPIEQTHHHHPQTCAACGAPLSIAESGRAHAGYLVIDLVPPSSERAGLEVLQNKHLYYEHDRHCGHRNRAEPGHGSRLS